MTDNIKSLVDRLIDRAHYLEAVSAPHTPSSVQLLKDAAARIAELESRTSAPIDRRKLVPIEPTLEMCQAASKVQTYDATFNKPFMTSGSCIYRHMLNAAPAAPVADGAMAKTQGARDVLAERERQVTQEGWTPEHDDSHDDGQMAAAAGYYALASSFPHERDLGRGHVPPYWPWKKSWWKPTTKRRNLVKAAALILAEIERLDRTAIAASAEKIWIVSRLIRCGILNLRDDQLLCLNFGSGDVCRCQPTVRWTRITPVVSEHFRTVRQLTSLGIAHHEALDTVI